MSQFLRKYRVLIMAENGATALDVSNLHCTFVVEKALDETPNYSQISIYNPSYDTEASIINFGKKVILEAGYENDNYGMIFSGEIVQPIRMKVDNVTRALVLICQDGDTYLNNSFTSMTIAAGATQNDVVKAVTGDAVPTGSITELSPTKLARGKVLFGQSAAYLAQVARSADAQMYIEDGVVNIVAAADYDSSTAVELNPYTGLIGTPEQTDDGISCKCLINPRIKLNTRIYINSTLVQQKQVEEGSLEYNAVSSDGIYRVYKMSMSGDTRGTDWYMSLEAITQSGEKPVGLTGDSTKLWR